MAETPRRLGDFEIVREVGRGGMGVVYEARQLSLNRQVALKVLSSGLGLSPRAVDRFRREAEAAARLHHSNIVPVYATGEQDGSHFYAMELIAGPSLDHVLRDMRQTQRRGTPSNDKSDPLSPEAAQTAPYVGDSSTSASVVSSSSLGSGHGYFDQVAQRIAEVADALDYAHRQGVIHRDVKPSNLLLSPEGRLSINDFGLARLLEQPGMTITGEFVGTPAYMSPEQIAAGRVPLDHRTDIYSLGATLYELLTLQPPFSGQRRDQVLAQIMQKDPVAPRRLNRSVPIDLETICLKALDKDPDRRYQTAGQMAEDLRRFVNRFAISAKRAGPLERLVKWVRRHPALTASLALALLAVAAAGVFAWQAHLAEARRIADAVRHEDELRQERQRNAIEKAVLAAMSGDFEGAENAIAEAELHGASTGQVRLLHGQVALHRGKSVEAVEHLKVAVKLLPESVAARALLAQGYSYTGRSTRFEETLQEVERLTPRTPEDYLFKGQAEGTYDPVRGLQTLDEAFRRRPSAIARLIRGEARVLRAMDLGDVELAAQAVEDAETARQLLPDNPLALIVSLDANMLAAKLLEEKGQAEEARAARDRARKNARSLERFASLPDAVVGRWVFLRSVGEDDVCGKELEQILKKTSHTNTLWSYALYLYRRGQFKDALKALEKEKGSIEADFLRCVVLAELPDGPARALKLQQEIAARDLHGWDLFNSQVLLRFLGRKAEAVQASRKFYREPSRLFPARKEQIQAAADYCAGELTADDALKADRGSRWGQCNVHFCIALTLLAEGDRKCAEQHFRQSIQTGAFLLLPYDLSWEFLARLEKDPTWPPWVPQKK
jgi:serine/threonine protein kinase